MATPHFDFWVCQGRMCQGHGADALHRALQEYGDAHDGQSKRYRVLRGGCYGLCELCPNVVVRRWPSGADLPDPSVDRLNLTGAANETVYSQLDPDQLRAIAAAHLEQDQTLSTFSRAAREASSPPRSTVAERIRQLRLRSPAPLGPAAAVDAAPAGPESADPGEAPRAAAALAARKPSS